jgi:CheY-like chemotaxis protein
MKLEEATVLVVDDEKDLREIFSAWLGRKGCRVLTAANGVEALAILDTEKVDVLVSDIRMPIMGGVALVRNIYERRLLIPSIIFVSGYGDVEPREMYGLGVEALMEKPLSRKDLIRTLEDSLREREQLWQTPAADPMAQNIVLEIESLESALRACEFQLGRGGCCFKAKTPLEEEKTIGLIAHFRKEGLDLKLQGRVRWTVADTLQAGVAFEYLDPSCRDWVIGAMHRGLSRSFIPPCDGYLSEPVSDTGTVESKDAPEELEVAVT